MPLILNIDTATTVCSVTLARDGKLLSVREVKEGNSHAEKITIFIQEVFEEAQLKLSDLDAVAVSEGPGSYTGLRIGISTAKGLCYALDKPLIAVETLKAMTVPLITQNQTSEQSPSLREGFRMGHDEKDIRVSIDPKYYLTDKKNWKNLTGHAQEARQNPTAAEELLWKKLKGKKLGVKFRRQHPVGQFIADFICIEEKIIVELDGKYHASQKEYDDGRTGMLNDMGFKVIRFENEEVMNGIEKVVGEILKNVSVQDPSPTPSRGEGALTPLQDLSQTHSKELGALAPLHKVLFCPMIDARRMEVYCAIYDAGLNEIKKTSAEIIDENSFSDLLNEHQIFFFGDGAEKCKPVLSHQPNAVFTENIFPSAKNMIALSEEKFLKKEFEDVSLFEPFYLKEFLAGKKSI